MNEPTHTLAVLRTTLGLSQADFAKLLDYSTPMIKKVEYGETPISERMALNATMSTGVKYGWLMEDDISKPICDAHGNPYTRETFEMSQAIVRRQKGDSSIQEYLEAHAKLTGMVGDMLMSAFVGGNHEVDLYRIRREVETMAKRFPTPAPITKLPKPRSPSLKDYAAIGEERFKHFATEIAAQHKKQQETRANIPEEDVEWDVIHLPEAFPTNGKRKAKRKLKASDLEVPQSYSHKVAAITSGEVAKAVAKK